MPRACSPQQEKPLALRSPHSATREQPQFAASRESPHVAMKAQHSQKRNNKKRENDPRSNVEGSCFIFHEMNGNTEVWDLGGISTLELHFVAHILTCKVVGSVCTLTGTYQCLFYVIVISLSFLLLYK